MKFTIYFNQLLCLIFLGTHVFTFAITDNWSRGDEQSKTTGRTRKIAYSTPEEETQLKVGQVEEGSRMDELHHDERGDQRSYSSSTFESDELDRDHEQQVTSNEGKSMSMDSAKSARQSMDNLVKDMRSKAMHSAYADATQLPMSEQTNNMIEQQPLSTSGRGAEHDHTTETDNNIRIAVKSKRRFEFVPVHFDRDDMRQPRMIEIASDSMPLRLHFKSQSAAIVVTQSHMSPPMKAVEETVTMDQPYRISHSIYKPIIQTVKEQIQPYRSVIQTLKPVIEDIRTIVPKDSDTQHEHQGGGSRPSYGGGISGSTVNQWSQVGMSGRKNTLKAPPTRPISPAYQLQQHQQTGGNRFGNRHQANNYDSVKGSESRHRIQKRTHQEVNGNFNRAQRHHRSITSTSVGVRRGFVNSNHNNGPMQFGSSNLVYVPMMPGKYIQTGRPEQEETTANHYNINNNNQQLGDYFAVKKRFSRYNVEPHFEQQEETGHFDRNMEKSDRLETVLVSSTTDYPEFAEAEGDEWSSSEQHSTDPHYHHLLNGEDFGNVIDDSFEHQLQSVEASNSRHCSGLNHRCPPGSEAEWSEMHSLF